MSNKINYVVGDATNPIGNGRKFICHICNDVGAWGCGFVMELSKKWKEPEKYYRSQKSYNLGEIQVVTVDNEHPSNIVHVVNMIAQHGISTKPLDKNLPPIRYVALEKCLDKLATSLMVIHGSVHMPMIGTGLAGGNWKIIERIIEITLIEKDIPVYVYEYNK